MTGLWASLALIFGAGGLVFHNSAEVIAAVFCLGMALISAVIRDWRINDRVTHR